MGRRKYIINDTGCWVWQISINQDGYGMIWVKDKKKMFRAHRHYYEKYKGKIPEGLQIDHLCHTKKCKKGKKCPHRACVNPNHLEPVTNAENIRRGNTGEYIKTHHYNTKKTHCKHGHPFSKENTYRFPLKNGKLVRQCRTCSIKRATEHQKLKDDKVILIHKK